MKTDGATSANRPALSAFSISQLDGFRFTFSVALRPQKPSGLLETGRGGRDGHLDFHTAPEL